MLKLLEPRAIAVIFSNIEDILLTNTEFLSSLEERQRSCRLYIDTIGDILDRDMINMINYQVMSFLPSSLYHPIVAVRSRNTASINQTRPGRCSHFGTKPQILLLCCRCVTLAVGQREADGTVAIA